MTDKYHKLLNLIEEIKEKLTDKEYKDILDETMGLKNAYEIVVASKKEIYSRLTRQNEAKNQELDKLKNHFIMLSVRHFHLQDICRCNMEEEDSDDE